MKLNPDCIRAVLIEIEALQEIDEAGRVISLFMNDLIDSTLTDDFSVSDIFYSVKQLSDGGLISTKNISSFGSTDWLIRDITPHGHEFLQNVKDNSVWEQTKAKAKSVGSFALSILSQIAVNIVSSRLG